MGLLVIARGGLLLRQEHITEKTKRRQWLRPWIRMRESKCSLCIFCKKPLGAIPLLLFYLNEN